jgi:transposase-like protein
MTAVLSDPIYTDETAARAHFEALRWANGRYCPHCGEAERTSPIKGKTPWLYYCNSCKKKFSATVGTVYERSHIPLHKWLAATHLMCASKKGVAAHQLHRMLGITYKSAWFMAHRIREAMADNVKTPMGGEGAPVEVDETYIGKPQSRFVNGRGWLDATGGSTKQKVVTLVERNGRARSIHVKNITAETIREVLRTNLRTDSRLMTDESHLYKKPGKNFISHEAVNHSKEEYARGDVTTNTVEGFFSIFKRGMRGVYQHCGSQHLQRYLNEFDFRYSNRVALGIDDTMRAEIAIKGTVGKRLTYNQSH